MTSANQTKPKRTTLEQRVARIENLLGDNIDMTLGEFLQDSFNWVGSPLPTTKNATVVQLVCERHGPRLEVSILVNGAYRIWHRSIGLTAPPKVVALG